MNIVIIKGRLTRDPEFRQTQSGIPLCRFAVAVDGFKDKDGNKQADFIECTAWRNTAEFISRYFSKGQEILVDGNLKNNNYEDQNGVKHYSYTVNVNKVYFCGSKSESGQQSNAPSGNNQQYSDEYAKAGTPKQAQAQQAAPSKDQGLNIGDLGDFEEILSDGEVPF